MPFSATISNVLLLLNSFQNDSSLSEETRSIILQKAIQLITEIESINSDYNTDVNFAQVFHIAEEVAQIGHWSIFHETGRLSWSDEVYKIFEIEDKSYILTVEDFYKCVHLEDLESLQQAFTNHLLHQLEYDVIHRISTFKGKLKWLRERAKTEYNTNGKPIFTVGVVSDITDSVVAKNEIVDQKNYIENLIEAIPDLVFVLNEKGDFIGGNYNISKRHLLQTENYLGKNIRDFMPEELSNHFINAFQRVKTSQNLEKITYEFPTQIGILYFEASVKSLSNEEFLVVSRDITQNHLYQKQIETQNEYLKQLSEISIIGIWELKLSNHEVYWSDMVRKIHEVPDDYDPNIEDALAFYLPFERNILQKEIDKLFKYGIPYDLNLKIKAANGKIKWVRTIGLPSFENGNLVKAYGTFQDISEIKERDLTIQKLSMAVEQSFASIVMTDLMGNIEYVNTKFTQVTGFTKDEIVGKNPRILRSEKSITNYDEMWALLTQGKMWSGEFLNRKKTGEYYWEFGIIYPLLDELGNIVNYIGVKEDITEKKKLQMELTESEIKLNNVLESAIESILTLDSNYCLMYFNHVFKDDFYARNGILVEKGMNLIDLLPSEKKIFWKNKIDTVLNKESINFEYEEDAEGETLYYEVNANPIINNDEVIGVNIFGVNNTEKKKTERFIKDSESKYRIVAENNYNWEFWQGPDGNYIYNSPSCEKITGYTFQEFNENPRLLLKILHPEDKEKYIHHHKNRLQTTSIKTNVFRIINKQGQVRILEHICQPIYNDGIYLGIRGTNVDVTEKNKHIDAIKEQNRLLKEITWIQSHEFRAPLARMMSLIDFLDTKDFTVFDEQQLINAIKQSADELDMMIRVISQKVYATKTFKE
ncbi:MAG: PAS domain S-box protein [Flavobacterium sp.]